MCFDNHVLESVDKGGNIYSVVHSRLIVGDLLSFPSDYTLLHVNETDQNEIKFTSRANMDTHTLLRLVNWHDVHSTPI